ncbi:MAG: sugar phosphate isomerase/epimerase [Lentisphaerae bacterium]|nr:sugar phosphate isomerase/epimerase [Lentisphaerota bacterium]
MRHSNGISRRGFLRAAAATAAAAGTLPAAAGAESERRDGTMAKIGIGVNLEFVRHEDKPFEWGVKKAAELGYEYVEPMLHWGRELLSEAGYFHSVSMLDDPLRVRRACEAAGVKLSGFSAHTPLCKPEISVEYLKQAVRFAAECGAPVVNTDEGPKPAWTTVEEDHVLMRYTLAEAARVAEPRGVLIGIEPHQQYSRTPDGLDRIQGLVKSTAIGINFDTGNSYLGGEDPYRWLERVLGRLVHLHAKDISIQQSGAERGKVTGTPVGCACGDGVIDWAKVVAICRRAPRDIVFSVECGTVAQAAKSIEHLKKAIAG